MVTPKYGCQLMSGFCQCISMVMERSFGEILLKIISWQPYFGVTVPQLSIFCGGNGHDLQAPSMMAFIGFADTSTGGS